MNRIVSFLKSKSFAILLFHAGLLLFNWPLLSLPAKDGEGSVFRYLIIAWAIMVAILIAVGQAIRHTNTSSSGD